MSTEAEVTSTQGRVRGVHIGESAQGGQYARVRLAGDPGYLMDFDDPEIWPDLKGRLVEVEYYDSPSPTTNYVYRVVVGVEVIE
jgi:hypothetical protein